MINAKTQPIFCQLSKKYDKGEVYKRLKNLKGNQKWAKVSVTDDLSPEENRKRQNLHNFCNLAKDNDIDAKVSGAALVVEGQRFTYKELHKLPNNLTLADAKQIPCEGIIAFQGSETFLSNLSKIPV